MNLEDRYSMDEANAVTRWESRSASSVRYWRASSSASASVAPALRALETEASADLACMAIASSRAFALGRGKERDWFVVRHKAGVVYRRPGFVEVRRARRPARRSVIKVMPVFLSLSWRYMKPEVTEQSAPVSHVTFKITYVTTYFRMATFWTRDNPDS